MGARMLELMRWGDRIEEAANDLGLALYPQEFECFADKHSFLALVSHDALRSVFPNWHFGREFERFETMAELGLMHVAEVVANISPCRAYLLTNNPLPLQVLVMAHVYGHNNFFKLNNLLNSVEPNRASEAFAKDAEFIERLRDTNDFEAERVDGFLNAARYLIWHKKGKNKEINCLGEDILRFILAEARLKDWEKEVLRIIIRWSDYLYPQFLTKLANEGWAAFLEWLIIEKANKKHPFPKEIYTECQRYHLELIRAPKSLAELLYLPNLYCYWLGHAVWRELAKEERKFIGLVSLVREIDDTAFIDKHLTPPLTIRLIEGIEPNASSAISMKDLVSVFRKVIADSYGYRQMPKIVVKDVSAGHGKRDFILKHIFDGRNLDEMLAQQCLLRIQKYLWREGDVILLSARRREGSKIEKVKYHCTDGRVEISVNLPSS